MENGNYYFTATRKCPTINCLRLQNWFPIRFVEGKINLCWYLMCVRTAKRSHVISSSLIAIYVNYVKSITNFTDYTEHVRISEIKIIFSVR